MGLTSSLFSGVSGLSVLGNAMTVIGDNIANVNTVGFKSSRVSFQDVLSQSVATSSGTAQVGRGTALGDVTQAFGQGSFESTESPTDLAIGGDGFFIVRHPTSTENQYYTRAGGFGFDKTGFFTNSAGYVVEGWALQRNALTGDVETVGSIGDIQLASFTSPPEATDSVAIIANLDSKGDNNSAAAIGGLSGAWDATNATPIGDSAYEYQTTVKVYDSLGSTHDVTLYFDKADTDQNYEYLVTCNPTEDKRVGYAGTAYAGLLGRGTLSFSPDGVMNDMTFSEVSNAGVWTAADPATDLTNQHYTFNPDFLGGVPMTAELNFGSGYNGAWIPDALSTTYYSSASTTVFQTATGYGAGDLQSISVDVDGVITGSYSNGQVTPLFRLALAKFQNVQGLFKEGGNLYKETRNSGDAITGAPGSNGLGSIAANSLEQSNVDISNEFVKMITTQRGFQANSKIVTTVDDMLAEVINMKR